MRRGRIVCVGAACAALLGASACGSTVAPSSAVTSTWTDGPVPVGTLAPSQTSPGQPGQLGTTGGSSLGPGRERGTAGGTHEDVGTPVAGRPVRARGITSTAIRVGVYRDTAEGANASALGLGDIGSANTKSKEDVVVADLNKRGGVLGRRLEVVYYDYEQSSSETLAQRDQAACEWWTSDRPVFAVLSEGFSDVLPACLARRGVPQINLATQQRIDSRTLSAVPTYLVPNGLALDHQGEPYVAGLERQGFLRPSGTPSTPVRLGLLTYDRPAFVRGGQSIQRALRARGHDVVTSYVKYPESSSDVGQSAANIQSAVLRFAQGRIDRVLFLDIGGAATVYFMLLADKNAYQPRYGLSSQSVPASLRAAGAPQAQLTGAVGTGWVPFTDLGTEPSQSPGGTACARLMRAGRQDISTPFAASVAMQACDRYWYFAAVADRATRLDAAGLVDAAERLRGYRPAATYAVAVRADRHDGAGAVRDFAFDRECDCFRPHGPLHPLR